MSLASKHGPLTVPKVKAFESIGALDAKKLSVLGAGRMKLSVLGTSGDHLGPLGTIWGPSGDHLGHGFDEVIDFITDPDLPECADRSV